MNAMEHPPPDAALRVWPALLVTPLLALGHLSLAYALVTPSCARQDHATLHALTAASLLVSLLMTLPAWRIWRRLTRSQDARSGATHSDAGDAESRQPFLALVATLVGALSTLVIAAMWLPVWVLPPCS
jgi:hypothetical protein